MDNTVSLKNTNKIPYKKGKQLFGSTFFFHSIWKVCGRSGFWWAMCNQNGTILLYTYHHTSPSPKLGSFIHKLSAANYLSSSGSPSITQNGHFTSTTPSPQHLHVAMLSVLGSDKSTVHCPPRWRTGSVAMDTPIHACSRRPSIGTEGQSIPKAIIPVCGIFFNALRDFSR